ncbi:MAG: archaellin/type IV pilin N-terminal domain-containing protein [Candidatus Bathyarchaeia archaeon]|jgi:flagellin-like protein
MNYRKFVKNSKAISPIFATLILIAIAVIAGVVVYMFTSGTLATMTGGGTAAQEKVAVQGITYNSTAVTTTTPTIAVYAQNTGTGTVTINGMIIKDSNGNTVQSAIWPALATSFASQPLNANSLTSITGIVNALAPGTYTVTLSTTKGGSFVSSSFVV